MGPLSKVEDRWKRQEGSRGVTACLPPGQKGGTGPQARAQHLSQNGYPRSLSLSLSPSLSLSLSRQGWVGVASLSISTGCEGNGNVQAGTSCAHAHLGGCPSSPGIFPREAQLGVASLSLPLPPPFTLTLQISYT